MKQDPMTAPAWKLTLLLLLLPTFLFTQTTLESSGKFRRSDRDGDGVKNKKDHCPDEAGTITLFGCPDSDGDGVTDSQDRCPQQAGIASLHGCPDRDADGIIDDLDQCPEKAGGQKTMGCPDTDNDGIRDEEDKCPDLAGVPSARGCPDADQDGISDSTDKCPNSPGPFLRQGCPSLKSDELAFLDSSAVVIFFVEKTIELSIEGMDYLDQLTDLLIAYPDFPLHLTIHTDSQGNTLDNQTLSDLQAGTIAKYLIFKGVSPGKIHAHAFGETRPIANNLYPEGRARNRRVELHLVTTH